MTNTQYAIPQLQKLLEDSIQAASNLGTRTTGELIAEVHRRLPAGTTIRVQTGHSTVSHKHYMKGLTSAEEIDSALRYRLERY